MRDRITRGRLFFHPIVYGTMLIYITLTYTTLAWGNSIASALFPEDHYFEFAGAISLFITAILFLRSFVKIQKSINKQWMSLIKKLVYIGLAVVLVFGAGEEISWGQRIFNLKTPQFLMSSNTQEELNLHNLSIFEGNDLFTFDFLFDIFWFVLVVAIPAVSMLAKPVGQFIGKYIPIIHWSIGPLFLYNYASAKLAKLIYLGSYTFDRVPFKQAVQEIKESNYELLFVLVGLFVLWEVSKTKVDEPNL